MGRDQRSEVRDQKSESSLRTLRHLRETTYWLLNGCGNQQVGSRKARKDTPSSQRTLEIKNALDQCLSSFFFFPNRPPSFFTAPPTASPILVLVLLLFLLS